MTIEALLNRLQGVHSRGSGKWSARCPAHADKSPSLSIRETDTKLLIHCFAGCAPKVIVEAMGLALTDLFTDSPGLPNQHPIQVRQKLDLDEVAFQFELGAIDRRVQAERILTAAKKFHPDEMTDNQLERTLNAIAGAYAHRDRAAFLETVADGMREKSFCERMNRDAA